MLEKFTEFLISQNWKKEQSQRFAYQASRHAKDPVGCGSKTYAGCAYMTTGGGAAGAKPEPGIIPRGGMQASCSMYTARIK